jgi:hypothetical protein
LTGIKEQLTSQGCTRLRKELSEKEEPLGCGQSLSPALHRKAKNLSAWRIAGDGHSNATNESITIMTITTILVLAIILAAEIAWIMR